MVVSIGARRVEALPQNPTLGDQTITVVLMAREA